MRTIEDQDHENTGACVVDSVLTLTGTFYRVLTQT